MSGLNKIEILKGNSNNVSLVWKLVKSKVNKISGNVAGDFSLKIK